MRPLSIRQPYGEMIRSAALTAEAVGIKTDIDELRRSEPVEV